MLFHSRPAAKKKKKKNPLYKSCGETFPPEIAGDSVEKIEDLVKVLSKILLFCGERNTQRSIKSTRQTNGT